jgi:hypothetical protein
VSRSRVFGDGDDTTPRRPDKKVLGLTPSSCHAVALLLAALL